MLGSPLIVLFLLRQNNLEKIINLGGKLLPWGTAEMCFFGLQSNIISKLNKPEKTLMEETRKIMGGWKRRLGRTGNESMKETENGTRRTRRRNFQGIAQKLWSECSGICERNWKWNMKKLGKNWIFQSQFFLILLLFQKKSFPCTPFLRFNFVCIV